MAGTSMTRTFARTTHRAKCAVSIASFPNCRWCLENGLAGGEPFAHNATHFAMVKLGGPNPGALIVPFRHVDTPFELTATEWSDLGEILVVARDHLRQHDPSGVTVGWNVGAAAGQHVFHAHLHVICRFDGEPKAGQGLRDLLR